MLQWWSVISLSISGSCLALNIPTFTSAGLATSPGVLTFTLGTALIQWPGARGVRGGEHKAADVTDTPLSSTVLFAW